MSFMQLYYSAGPWIVAETNAGTEVFESDLIATNMAQGDEVPLDKVKQYCEGNTVFSAEVQNGFCARYSANGYMDRTDWSGPYETKEEAIKIAKEMYGDEEEMEDEEE